MNLPKNAVVLNTMRLMLRPLCQDDIPQLLPLIGAREVAATTLRIPHPYTEEDALKFLEYSDSVWEKRQGVRFGIFLREAEQLCGGMGLDGNLNHNHAELGYWIGVPFWGHGYTTEAAREVLKFGFENLQFHRIHAGHFANNPASGRVLQKLGMKHEGTSREHVCKWGKYLDVEIYGILQSEYREKIGRG